MVANKMPLLAALSSADCSSPRCPRCSSFQRCSAFSMGCAIALRRRVLNPKNFYEKRFEGDANGNAIANTRTSSHRRAAINRTLPTSSTTRLACRDCSPPGIRRALSFRYCYTHPHHCHSPHRNGEHGDPHSFGGFAETLRTVAGNCAAGQRTTLCCGSDLRSHERLPSVLVLRYRSAREKRATARGDRLAGSRPAIGAIA